MLGGEDEQLHLRDVLVVRVKVLRSGLEGDRRGAVLLRRPRAQLEVLDVVVADRRTHASRLPRTARDRRGATPDGGGGRAPNTTGPSWTRPAAAPLSAPRHRRPRRRRAHRLALAGQPRARERLRAPGRAGALATIDKELLVEAEKELGTSMRTSVEVRFCAGTGHGHADPQVRLDVDARVNADVARVLARAVNLRPAPVAGEASPGAAGRRAGDSTAHRRCCGPGVGRPAAGRGTGPASRRGGSRRAQ